MAMNVEKQMKEGILSEDTCEIYHVWVSLNFEKMCTYNTDCKTPSHYECTWHRFMVDLGAETVCPAFNQHATDGTTLTVLCHLYASVTQWLSAGNTGVNNSMVSDTDAYMTFRFSSPDCTYYNSLTENWHCTCASNVHNEVLGRNKLTWDGATNCLLYHFMTKMGARRQCENISTVNDTKNKTTMTLISKDRHFYFFITELIDVKHMCTNTTMAMNVERQIKEGILSERNCKVYHKWVSLGFEKMCTYNTDCKTPSHYECTWHRFMVDLGAESVCPAFNQHATDGTTLTVLCHLYASVTQWLSAGNTGMNNSMVSDTDAYNMTFRFSSPDCTQYNSLTENWHCTCTSNVHNEVLGRNKLTWVGAMDCLFYHFMIKMGAREQCSNTSEVNDTKNETTMTLISKDRYFYSFITEVIDVKHMCTNTTMAVNVEKQMKEGILSEDICEIYHVSLNFEKICTYNTDCKTPSHYECTWHRFMVDLGAESVCPAFNQHATDGTTLTVLCHLYASVTQWLSAGNTGVNNSMVSDTDAYNMTFRFSSPDCTYYNSLTENWHCTCASNVHNDVLGRNKLSWSDATGCLLYHFMTKMGAGRQCRNISTVNDTKNKTTMTLISKDRHVYFFITELIDVKHMCTNTTMAMNVESQIKEGILSERNCKLYHKWMSLGFEKMCTYNTDCKTPPSHDQCTWYRFMADLGAESDCLPTYDKTTACRYYNFVMVSIVGGVVCLIGLVCNSISLCTFCRGKVKTPTSYQFQWLAGVDSLVLVLLLGDYAVYYAVDYWQYNPDSVYF